jgi:hypothetical protein
VKRRWLLLLAALAGCAGGPGPADWQLNAASSLQSFERYYLTGETRLAEAEFKRARSEVSRTGRPELIARVELARCAVRTASLEFDDCPAFQALRDAAGKEELAYSDYLAGKGARAAGDEPLSRLVAAAVALKKQTLDPAAIAAAVDTASAQGWRRPLLAWLGVQLRRAEAAGDREAATQIRRRMDLISG